MICLTMVFLGDLPGNLLSFLLYSGEESRLEGLLDSESSSREELSGMNSRMLGLVESRDMARSKDILSPAICEVSCLSLFHWTSLERLEMMYDGGPEAALRNNFSLRRMRVSHNGLTGISENN